MSEMADLLNSFSLTDGRPTESRLKGVRFAKTTRALPRHPIVYDPCIFILAQGHKIGYLGGGNFDMMPTITW